MARASGPSAYTPALRFKTVGTGTQAKVTLLKRLSAWKSNLGEPFNALLIESLRLSSEVTLLEGTVSKGRVNKRVRARLLSRPGGLYLTFNQ